MWLALWLNSQLGQIPVPIIGLILCDACGVAPQPGAFVVVAGLILVIPIMCSELAPEEAKQKLRILFGYQVSGSLLVFLVNLVASYFLDWAWRLPFEILGVLALFLLVISSLVDETPKYLVERGKLDVAENVVLFALFLKYVDAYVNLTKVVAIITAGTIAVNYASFNRLTNPHGWISTSIEGPSGALADVWMNCLNLFMMFIMNEVAVNLLCALQYWIFICTVFFIAITVLFICLFVPETTFGRKHNMVRLVWSRRWLWRIPERSSPNLGVDMSIVAVWFKESTVL
ncbi:hypothetical protein ACH5RR_034288 [Cinchona calisaya]|uniref:Major facilitator superfamily (MFS) profile domain-containing protein n=1 Tax=Cinchona calisaya TaxID=153742 RepID=A0ABD2YAG1_9GENT